MEAQQGFETPHHAPELELELFRRGLGSMRADRECCPLCSRTPLTGETVVIFSGPSGEQAACAGCAASPAAARLGSALRRQLVRPGAGTVTVLRAA